MTQTQQPNQPRRQNRGPQQPRLPALLFDPIEKHASEEFGRWAAAHDWTRFNRRFADRAKEIQDGKPGGFTLIAHNAIKLVIDPLVTNNTLPAAAKDEFQAICDQVMTKLAEEKRLASAAETKKRAEAAASGIVSNFAKVNETVGKILDTAGYPFIAAALQQRWQELLDSLRNYEREDFFAVMAKMESEERQEFIHSILKIEDENERRQMALAHTPTT